jgi:hypothetical protein
MTPNYPPGGPGSPPKAPISADVVITYGPNLEAQAGAGGALPAGTVTETYRGVTLTKTITTTSSSNPASSVTTPDPNFIETRIGTAANFVSNLVTVSAAPAGSTPAWPHSIPAGPQYFGPLYANPPQSLCRLARLSSRRKKVRRPRMPPRAESRSGRSFRPLSKRWSGSPACGKPAPPANRRANPPPRARRQ